MILKFFLLFLLTALFAQPKNIIFMIGDGMGIGQIQAARISNYGIDGRLNMERFPVTGLVNTHSSGSFVTNSAAAATAFATGHKTDNVMVSMLPDGTKLKTILQLAKEKKKATGIVTTTAVTHATPACFVANVKNRDMQEEIAEWILEHTKPDLVLGGGKRFFSPKTRSDRRDLIKFARSSGYRYVETENELMKTKSLPLLGLFASDGLRRKPHEPNLIEMTQKAIELLSKDPDGFFLMVEGGQIDWACHDNDLEKTIQEIIEFDNAVGVALKFAEKDKQTLIIVIGDHETGGLVIVGGKDREAKVSWATGAHTAMMVPVFAYGVNSELFSGVKDNTEIGKILFDLLD